MDAWLVVLITFIVAFVFGTYSGKAHPRYGSKFLLRTLVTVLALAMSVLSLTGLIAFISPTLALALGSKLSNDLQDILLTDVLLRGGTGLWVFLILLGVFWYARTSI